MGIKCLCAKQVRLGIEIFCKELCYNQVSTVVNCEGSMLAYKLYSVMINDHLPCFSLFCVVYEQYKL